MSKLTEEQKEKGRSFAKMVGDITWNASVLAVILLLIAGFIGGVMFLYVFNDSTQQAEAELLKDAYEGRAYCPTEGIEHDATYYVDFADLGVTPLAYSYEGRNGSNLPLTDYTEYTYSMIDDENTPTEEFTLHYEVWDTVDPFFTGRRVNSLKKHCDDEITVPELDYGADEAYWLGDDLLLRYGKSHLILFRNDTTRELIDSEVCADFMRNDMQLEKPTWY